MTWQSCDQFPIRGERGAEAEEYTIIGLATSDDPDAIGVGLFIHTGPTRIAGANTREEAEMVAARMRQQPGVFFVAITQTLKIWKVE